MSARRVRQYVYSDPKGRPKLRKLRFDPKDFWMESWNEPSAERIKLGAKPSWVLGTDRQAEFAPTALYHLPEVLWALRDGNPIAWTEGEKCADAVRGVGGVATTHWQGACNATAEQAGWFSRGIGPVFVVVDVDNAGAACGLARRRLLLDNGTSSSRITLLAPPRPHKDAADAIMAGHGLDEFREVTVPQLRTAAAKYVKQRADGAKRTKSDWYGSDGRLLLPDGWDRK